MSYKILDYRSRKPITVRTHTRNGRLGFMVQIKFFVRQATIYSLIAIIVVSSYASTYFLGMLNAPIVAEAQVITQTVKDPTIPPVLLRINKAETHDNQFCSADAIARKYCHSYQKGEVLETTNTNGSVDIGEYAINNAAYGAQAMKLGYDIYTEQGNQDMATWIYQNVGTGPWYASEANWK